MGEVITFRPVAEDDWQPETNIPALADALRLGWQDIQEADCPGNINADIPAMVLTDLAATALDRWWGDDPAMDRSTLLAVMCGALGYMFDWFKSGADDAELERLRTLTSALDALTEEDPRSRFGKVPGMQPEAKR